MSNGEVQSSKNLKENKARSQHICYNCGKEILPGETYYREHIEDKFLHSLHAKIYCSSCYEKHGKDLLLSKE
ncbi:MAG: hypothetical protein EF806_00945 [Candidatus Methanoliparum thermophilum]|uniref:Uncharacterized protein n=1 Tax=Methanoliparum thermophilum TaxID=2491083 RepID=A0A520KTW7_METT2|nr:MAG: hypothetical protein EF806_00945 [Candidatus Methanoliparum thermophilum]